MNDHRLSRRNFLRQAALTLPAGALLMNAPRLRAQDLPKLEESDPTAQALLYVHDAGKVDASNPMAARYEAGQMCSNCAQIQGEAGADWRPCGIFPGKLVNAGGWCSVWAPKP